MHLVNDSWQLTDLKAKHRFHIHFIQITVTPESNLHPYILSDNEKIYLPAIAFTDSGDRDTARSTEA
jgi:hypothetical protein